MRTTQSLSITLSIEMAEMVKAKVASGNMRPKAKSSAMVCGRFLPATRRSRNGWWRKSCRPWTRWKRTQNDCYRLNGSDSVWMPEWLCCLRSEIRNSGIP